MLQNIGDKLKGGSESGQGKGGHRWLAYALFGALILVFVAWGPYAAVDLSFNQSSYAVKVNGEKISTAEVNETWQQRLPQLLERAGGTLSEEQRRVEQDRLLESAVGTLAAMQHARKLGFRVSDSQIKSAFEQEPAFQIDGKFSSRAALARLAQAGFTPQAYEADLRRTLLTQQLDGTIASTDFLTPAESKRLLALLDEEREVRFALLQPDAFAGSAPVEPQAIEAWYKAHQSEYTVPESVRLDYAELAQPDVAAGITVTDEQLKQRYEQEKARFVQPETRHARHILIAVDGATNDAKASAQAQDLYKQLQGGADFAALAKQYSKDSVSAEQGGDLGWAAQDTYDKEFGEKLFAMKDGEVSAPVKTQYGYQIIKLEGIRPASGRSLDDVRAELTTTLRNEQAAKEFTRREDQLQERLERGGSNLDQLVREFGLQRGTVDQFVRGAGGLPLGSDAELNRLVFSDASLSQRRVGGPVQLGEDRITIFQVQEHREAKLKPLDEVKDSVVAAVKRERGSAAALAAAEAAAARLKAGESFDQVLASLKLKADPAHFVSRSTPDLPVQVRDATFAGPRPEPGKPHAQAVKIEGGAVALLAVTGSRVQALSDNPQIEQLRTQRELQRYSQRDIDAYLADVIARAKVSKNPNAFQQ